MTLLRVLLIEGRSGLADLLDDGVRLVLLDEPLDTGVIVTGDDDEAVAPLEDPAVLIRSKFNGLEARDAVALAVEAHRRGDPVPLAALLDLLVDAAERLLVLRCPPCEVHALFYH